MQTRSLQTRSFRTTSVALVALLVLALASLPAAAQPTSGAAAPGTDLIDPEVVERLADWRAERVSYRNEPVAGQLLVTTEEPGAVSWADAAGLGADQVTRSGSRVHLVTVDADAEAATTARIAASPGVVAVEPVLSGEFFAAPDDELYDQQWSHQQTGIEAAWDITTGSADVEIVVADSGVDARHPDLTANIAEQWDAGSGEIVPGTDGDNDPAGVGHGTLVAGVVGAVGNNGLGVAGVNWETSVIDVNTADPRGFPTTASVVASVAFAAERGADAVNLSLGLGANVPCPAAMQSVIDDANAAGTAVVVSSGNGQEFAPDTPYVPASCNGVLSVGAVGHEGEIAVYSTQNEWVDLAAPGGSGVSEEAETEILTTAHTDSGLEYAAAAGTSFSAPYVAGVVGLLRTVDPNITVTELEGVLEATAVNPAGDDEFTTDFGWGNVDPGAAVELAAQVVAGEATYPEAAENPDYPVGHPSGFFRLAADEEETEAVAQAVAASQQAFADEGAAWAVVARGDDYADALAGSTLTFGAGPVLYTGSEGGLDDATAAELQRVLPDGAPVIVLGGSQAVPVEAEEDVVDLGFAAERLAGPTRAETAEEVARFTADLLEEITDLPVPGVILATAANWPDAITAGSLGIQFGLPILLTNAGEIHPAAGRALEDLSPDLVIAVGGAGVISEDTERDAADIADAETIRLGGGSRIDTAVEVGTFITAFYAELGFAPSYALAANVRRDDGYAHMLSASGQMAFGAVFIPVEGDAGDMLEDQARDFADLVGADLATSGVAIGGADIVSDDVLDELGESFQP